MTWKQLAANKKFIGGVLESFEEDGRYRMVIQSMEHAHSWMMEIRVDRVIRQADRRWLPHKDHHVFEFLVENILGNLPIDTRGPKPIYAPPVPDLVGLPDGRVLIVPRADSPSVRVMILYPKGMLAMSELAA